MKKITQQLLTYFFASAFILLSYQSKAHCELPCGIYGDSVRVELIYEHIATIEKSMNMINTLSEADSPDYNQLVRWVMNKEDHAKQLQDIVSQYFLHQRVKPKSYDDKEAYRKYTKQLELLHKISFYAMKSKQSTDLGVIETLRENVNKFEHAYFDKNHTHSH